MENSTYHLDDTYRSTTRGTLRHIRKRSRTGRFSQLILNECPLTATISSTPTRLTTLSLLLILRTVSLGQINFAQRDGWHSTAVRLCSRIRLRPVSLTCTENSVSDSAF